MLNPGQNIFDLLLGGNSLTGLPSSPTAVEPVADVLFDDVLAGLVTTVGSKGNIVDIPTGATPCPDQEVLLPVGSVENRLGEILPESLVEAIEAGERALRDCLELGLNGEPE